MESMERRFGTQRIGCGLGNVKWIFIFFTITPSMIIVLFNSQSLINKPCLIHDRILDKSLDLMCITETWHQPHVFAALNEACPPGCHYLQKA